MHRWVLFAVLLRWCISLWPYSGAHSPPLFGDYEAQRHWMELTIQLPLSEWYFPSPRNDIYYWGLDYPPLTAYVSYMMGRILSYLDPEMLLLHSSRGYESEQSKTFMRLTVLISDLLLYFPALFFFLKIRNGKGIEIKEMWRTMALFPALVLIDHGHFQVRFFAKKIKIQSLNYYSTIASAWGLHYGPSCALNGNTL